MANPPNLTYCKIVGNFKAFIADNQDSDDLPDFVPMTGTGQIWPNVTTAKNTQDGYKSTYFNSPVPVTVDEDGDLSQGGRKYVMVLAESPTLNPSKFNYSISLNMSATGETNVRKYGPFSFDVIPDGEVDITDVIPVSAYGGAPVVQGPQGPQGPEGVRGPGHVITSVPEAGFSVDDPPVEYLTTKINLPELKASLGIPEYGPDDYRSVPMKLTVISSDALVIDYMLYETISLALDTDLPPFVVDTDPVTGPNRVNILYNFDVNYVNVGLGFGGENPDNRELESIAYEGSSKSLVLNWSTTIDDGTPEGIPRNMSKSFVLAWRTM